VLPLELLSADMAEQLAPKKFGVAPRVMVLEALVGSVALLVLRDAVLQEILELAGLACDLGEVSDEPHAAFGSSQGQVVHFP